MKKTNLLILGFLMVFGACSRNSTYTYVDNSVALGYSGNKVRQNNSSDAVMTRPAGMIPKATAFKMSGNYADNVAITLDGNGNITYFPAPSDISKSSKPEKLTGGWWLNRQGISNNSVFTKYTFEEYASLPSVPSLKELRDAIIPGANVTEMIVLPYNISEAQGHIVEINEYLKTVND